jgi:hypothetical protein
LSRPIIKWSRLEKVDKSFEYIFNISALSFFGDGLAAYFPLADAIFFTFLTEFVASTYFLAGLFSTSSSCFRLLFPTEEVAFFGIYLINCIKYLLKIY